MIGKRITIQTIDDFEISLEVIDKILVAQRITRNLHQHEQEYDREKLEYLGSASVTNYLCKTITIRSDKKQIALAVYRNPKTKQYFEVGKMSLIDPLEFWAIV